MTSPYIDIPEAPLDPPEDECKDEYEDIGYDTVEEMNE